MHTSINEIMDEIKELSDSEKLELINKVVKSITKDRESKNYLDWNEMYGLGKEIWKNEDGQNYINQLREDR